MTSLVREIGFLLGAPIHYYAAIDLAGFRRMIDLVGGVTVDNPRAINDPRYNWLDGERLPAERRQASSRGRTALAYVRSRQGAGDTDFSRARRQQQVLLALREQLTKPKNLPQIPGLLDAAGDTIRTNFPSDRVGEMIDLAQRIDTSTVKQVRPRPAQVRRRATAEHDRGDLRAAAEDGRALADAVDRHLRPSQSRYAENSN